MSAKRDREKEIFDTARELASYERAAYLTERCGQDAELRQRIEGMLEADAAMVQPVKSLPLKSGFYGSADCSDAVSMEQSSVTTAREMPFCFSTSRFMESIKRPVF